MPGVEPGAGGRILIVDDDRSVARSIVRLATPFGEPVVAGTAQEGIQLLDLRGSCRAAILDFLLPDGSAVDILRHASGAGNALPALVVTGQEIPGAEEAVRTLGADFLLKPVASAAIESFLRDGKTGGVQKPEVAPESAATRLLSGMAVAAIAELRAQYDIGQHVHRLRYPSPGEVVGSQALADLGRRLNLHPSALRRRARVSERIRPDEFEVLIGLRSARGLPLTWSHLELLALVRGRTQRESLARKIVAGDIGIRQCSALVHTASRDGGRREA